MDQLSDAMSTLGNIGESVINTINYLMNFISNCIGACGDLLSVIPEYVSVMISAAIIFSVVIACKRAIL